MITGKVAAIINSRELAINRGEEDGVVRGMKFSVLDSAAAPVTDPDTGKKLGSVRNVKVRVEVVGVQPKFAIARTYELVGGSSGFSSLGLIAAMGGTAPRVRTLKTDEAIFQPLTEAESYVKRGDQVEEIGDDKS